MLGGPQAGIILGRAGLVESIKRNPLLRALRIDKLSLAALGATLRLYLPPNDPQEQVPVLRMINEDRASVGRRASELLRQLEKIPGITGVIKNDVSFTGGGALPMNEIPTKVVQIRAEKLTAIKLAERLRVFETPVIGRIANDVLHLDLRTVQAGELSDLTAALEQAVT